MRPLQAVEEAEVVAEAEVAEVEVAEVEVAAEEAEEVAEEEDKQTLQLHPVSDSAETLQKYSRETERRQTASSLNSNDTT